jgi:hypothetical protein
VNAVDIVTAGKVTAETSQIVGCAWILRVEETVLTNPLEQFGVSLAQVLASCSVPLAARYGDHPGVHLQSALVTLVDSKGKGVVARRLTWFAAQTAVPGLHVRREYGGSPDARLYYYGIDICLDQAVKYLAQLALLHLHRTGLVRLGIGVWPVNSADGGKPYGTHFVQWFRHRRIYTEGGGVSCRHNSKKKGIKQCCNKKFLHFEYKVTLLFLF